VMRWCDNLSMFFLATNDLFSLFNRNYLIKAMSIISPRCDIRYLIFVVFLDFYMIQMIILFILNKYVRNFLLFSRYGYLWHIYSSLARNHDAAAAVQSSIPSAVAGPMTWLLRERNHVSHVSFLRFACEGISHDSLRKYWCSEIY